MNADIITFPRTTETFPEQCQRWSVSLKTIRLAKALYEARCAYIGGGCLPWGDLTVMQQTNFYLEMEGYVRLGEGENS